MGSPGGALGPSWVPFGRLLQPGGGPGGVLGGARAVLGRKNIIGDGSWTARSHRGDRFQHAWGPNGRPKGAPGGSQIGIQKRSELKMVKPCFLTTVARISMIFQVSGRSLRGQKWVQNGVRIASSTRKPWNTSWEPLGSLLERFGAEKILS